MSSANRQIRRRARLARRPRRPGRPGRRAASTTVPTWPATSPTRTVGAGLETAILGVPAICLSLQTAAGTLRRRLREDLASAGLAYDFGFAAAHGASLAQALIRARPAGPVTLSVYYPARRAAASSMIARPGLRDYPRAAACLRAGDGDVHRVYLFEPPGERIPEADASRAPTSCAAAYAPSACRPPWSRTAFPRLPVLPRATDRELPAQGRLMISTTEVVAGSGAVLRAACRTPGAHQ